MLGSTRCALKTTVAGHPQFLVKIEAVVPWLRGVTLI
jgi:hypothetical protein